MINDNKEPEIAEEAPAVKPRISVVIVLSVVLGMLVATGGVGAYLYFKQSRVLQAEVLFVKNELKKKNQAFDEMSEQIKALSKQMNVLKEYSIARSGSAVDTEKKKEDAVLVTGVAHGAQASADIKGETTAPGLPLPAIAKKAKPKVPDCELVGKSPNEQAATLKRCVGLIDPPPEKTRSR